MNLNINNISSLNGRDCIKRVMMEKDASQVYLSPFTSLSIKFINEEESENSYKYKEDWGCENNL